MHSGERAPVLAPAMQHRGGMHTLPAEQEQTTDELRIRQLVDGLARAIRARDIGAVMAPFSPDVISFDVRPPLQHGGGEAFAARWRSLFDSYQGPIAYELHDLTIAVDGDVAFSRSLNRMTGTTRGGEASDRWLRWTACYRRANDAWLIVHEHVSVPAP
jgi:uncharacterized protein (TIGR02246 family)